MVERAGLIRSGGRTERIRQAVVSAVLSILEDGSTDLSFNRLAIVSGVHVSTIYRRWPTRELLLAEVLGERRQDFVIAPWRTWQAYLKNLAVAFRDFSLRPREMALSSVLMTTSDPAYADEVRHIWGPFADDLAAPLRECQKRGEIARGVDPQTIIIMLTGTILSQIMFTKEVPSDDFLTGMVACIVKGIENKNAQVAATRPKNVRQVSAKKSKRAGRS